MAEHRRERRTSAPWLLILLAAGRLDLFPYGALVGGMFGSGSVSGRAEQARARHPDLQH